MKFIDFFAGIGGFHLAFEEAGHKCVGWCEIDRYARRSYEAIHDTKGLWTADDIRAVKPSDLPPADIYTFGFPCQSFSVAGKRGGFDDTRGTLFFEVMRLAKARQPRLLVAENVSGLLSHGGGGRHSESSLTQWKSWGIASSGRRLTADTICHKTARASSLSDIMEDSVDEKYFLSDAAATRLMKGGEPDGLDN
jgi:DNA (cytosine-5)-methyltransferase 1